MSSIAVNLYKPLEYPPVLDIRQQQHQSLIPTVHTKINQLTNTTKMKLAIISLITALAATAFAWPQAHIEFLSESGKGFNEVFVADGNNHAISMFFSVYILLRKMSDRWMLTRYRQPSEGVQDYLHVFHCLHIYRCAGG